jgi:hypothetical protein
MESLGTEGVKALAAELVHLWDMQLEALKTATYIPMSDDDWQLYEDRQTRINKLLGKAPM